MQNSRVFLDYDVAGLLRKVFGGFLRSFLRRVLTATIIFKNIVLWVPMPRTWLTHSFGLRYLGSRVRKLPRWIGLTRPGGI